MERQIYPSGVSDLEWAFVSPYLTLMREDAPQREPALREVFNGLRCLVRNGEAWRMMPHNLPPWYTVYQQSQCWLKAGVFEAMVDVCGRYCVWPMAVRLNRVRSSSTVGRCSPAPRARYGVTKRYAPVYPR